MKRTVLIIALSAFIIQLSAQDSRTSLLQELEKGNGSQQVSAQNGILTSASRLFGAKDDLTTVITILPAGTEVEITGSDSVYYSVKLEETAGYVFKRHITIKEGPARVESMSDKQAPAEIPEQQAQEEQPVSRFAYLENKYGSSTAAKLMAGKVWKGMDTGMVRDSWGKPQKINRVIAGNTIKEEWIYKSTWLYFENDDLVEWGPVR